MSNKNVDIINLCNNIILYSKGGDIDQALLAMKKHLLEYDDKHDDSYNKACGIYAGLKAVKLQQTATNEQEIKTIGDLRRVVERELAA